MPDHDFLSVLDPSNSSRRHYLDSDFKMEPEFYRESSVLTRRHQVQDRPVSHTSSTSNRGFTTDTEATSWPPSNVNLEEVEDGPEHGMASVSDSNSDLEDRKHVQASDSEDDGFLA